MCRGEAIPFSTLSLRAERMRSVAIPVVGCIHEYSRDIIPALGEAYDCVPISLMARVEF